MKFYIVALLLFSAILFGCTSQQGQQPIAGDNTTLGPLDAPAVENVEENGEVLNASEDLDDVDISEEELNETLS